MRLVDRGWTGEVEAGLARDQSSIRLVSPFIKAGVMRELFSTAAPTDTQVITRFNLPDFASGVSDIEALRAVLDMGGRVRGIQGLHAKLFLFGESRAIVTSANLTRSGLRSNYEFGCVSEEPEFVDACDQYFRTLWDFAGPDLTYEQVADWSARLDQHLDQGARWADDLRLPDFGAVGPLGGPDAAAPRVHEALPMSNGWATNSEQSFVKFFGSAESRVLRSRSVVDEMRRTGCHWACTYPANKRPRKVRDGDTLFVGSMVKAPHDTMIFGRVIGRAYRQGHDDATAVDVLVRPFKEMWPHYIRVHHGEFLVGDLANGVSLDELMTALGPDSFASTQANLALGGNVEPRRAIRQQPAVHLSATATAWLTERLEDAFVQHGQIPASELAALDWPDAAGTEGPFLG